MHSYIYVSPYLKFKNNKVYILDQNNINSSDYENNNYYITLDNIQKKNIIQFNNTDIMYEIIHFENDKNLLIKINFDKDLISIEINRLMHFIDSLISEINQNDYSFESNILKYNNIITY